MTRLSMSLQFCRRVLTLAALGSYFVTGGCGTQEGATQESAGASPLSEEVGASQSTRDTTHITTWRIYDQNPEGIRSAFGLGDDGRVLAHFETKYLLDKQELQTCASRDDAESLPAVEVRAVVPENANVTLACDGHALVDSLSTSSRVNALYEAFSADMSVMNTTTRLSSREAPGLEPTALYRPGRVPVACGTNTKCWGVVLVCKNWCEYPSWPNNQREESGWAPCGACFGFPW